MNKQKAQRLYIIEL